MPKGPLGGPRPFAQDQCQLVYVVRAVGRPEDEVIFEIQEEINRKARGIKPNSVEVEVGQRAMDANTFTMAMAVQFAGVKQVQEYTDNVNRTIENRLAAGARVSGVLKAGDPRTLVSKGLLGGEEDFQR